MNNCPYEEAEKEMHLLAYVYHWGSYEIEKCPIRKRRRWINQIKEQYEAEKEAMKHSD